jgi:hypothetical protein
MRKLLFLLPLVLFGCAHMGTMVVPTAASLTISNFTVVNRVYGKAVANYVFGVFGPPRQQLAGDAITDMYLKANLKDKTRVITDVVIDWQMNYWIFGYSLLYFASGNVVEFFTADKMNQPRESVPDITK